LNIGSRAPDRGYHPGVWLILGYHLEYTHTYKGLPLNCHEWQELRGKGLDMQKQREKPQFFN